MGYRIHINFILFSSWSDFREYLMTIGRSQPPTHAVCVDCDRRTGTRVRIPQPIHGKDPEGVGVGGEVGKDVGVAKSVSTGGPSVLVGVLLLQLVVLNCAPTVVLGRLPDQSRVTVPH